jgi:transposase-like protein
MHFKRYRKSEIKNIIQEFREKRLKRCSKCHSETKYLKNKKDQVICTWVGCKKRANIWRDTVFYRTRLSKIKVLQIIELWMNNMSMNNITYVLRLSSRKVVWRVLKNVSRILVPRYEDANIAIGGNDIIVEIDESKFGERKYNRGHHVEGVWALGMVERTPERKIKLVVVDDRSRNTFKEKIVRNLSKESIVYTDCWKGYNGLDDTFSGHKTVNHSVGFKDATTGTHTNTIERCWSGIKMNVPLRGRTKDKVSL